MLEKLRAYIRERELVRPGDRVGVAVSGGADSVGLLRGLLELRDELGVVLSVVHFNHKIRGAEADADEEFVRQLAARFGLDFHGDSGDATMHAREHKLSLETAARELRYGFFRRLLTNGVLDKVATAHTMDDQAETVLMRLVRGAGTKGLAGIYPVQKVGEASIVRPMLAVRRREVEGHLRALAQDWREDPTNRDLRHLRNRVRHQLLPLLEREFNPGIAEVLSNLAQMAREEQEQRQREVESLLPRVFTSSGEEGGVIRRDALEQHPVATRRRLLRAACEALGIRTEFEHIDGLLRLCSSKGSKGKTFELPAGWRARVAEPELLLEKAGKHRQPRDYEYPLPVPGEVRLEETGSLVRARVAAGNQALDRHALAAKLVIRNWRPGDRFWPAHSKGPKKVKELLQEKGVPQAERAAWPVVVSNGIIVWVRGLGPPAEFVCDGEGVVIEELASG
jgi:tRNA(Ile)-lysidine synthase